MGGSAQPSLFARVAIVVLVSTLTTVAAAQREGCREVEPEVVDVRFLAARWVDSAGLRRISGLEPPFRWRPERADEVRASLMQTQMFRSVELRPVSEGEACTLVVELDLRPTVRDVNLEGVAPPRLAAVLALLKWITFYDDPAPLPTEREIYRLLPFRSGTFFDPASLDRASQRIIARYQAAGYQSASVSTRVVENKGMVAIDVVVNPGSPLLITEVVATANRGEARAVAEEVLRETLGQTKGRRLEREVRREILRRLRRQGFFGTHVTVTWRAYDATSGRLKATLEAEEPISVDVVGNDSVGTDDLITSDGLYDRVIVTDNTWRQLAVDMKEVYQGRGFFEASVELTTPEPDRMVYEVDEGPRFDVDSVVFTGNRAVPREELIEIVSTGARGLFSVFRSPRVTDTVLAEDVERIQARYRRAGYESASVAPSVTLDRDLETAAVVFAVEEGPLTLVRSVDVEGDAEAVDGALVAAVVGEALDTAALDDERNRILKSLQARGYLDATVELEVARESAGEVVDAEVTWGIASGPLHRIGEIVIQENAEVQYVVVERDLPFKPGEPIRNEALLDAQHDVYGAGVFRNVSIFPFPSAAPRQKAEAEVEAVDGDAAPAAGDGATVERDVAVRVVARPPGRFSYGLGYDTLQGLTGFGEIRYSNLNRRAQRLRLRGQIGFEPGSESEPTQYLATVSFVEPRLLDGPWDWQLNALAERNTRSIDQYKIERYSVATGSSRTIASGVRAGADIQVEYASVFDVDPVPFLGRDEADSWTTAISPYIVYDGRDSAFNPRAGFFETLRLRYALPGVSGVDLFELVAQHTHLIPLPGDWGFVYSVRVGWVHSLDGDPIVPIRQRYFIGGGESVRGFAVNSLGPYDGNGNEVGGDLAIVAKTELRIPLFWGLGLVVFLDAGGNYLVQCDSACRAGDDSDPDTRIRDARATFDNFRAASGLGLRYVTPIGPISVDYGFKLDRKRRQLSEGATDRESLGEFSVSVGARF